MLYIMTKQHADFQGKSPFQGTKQHLNNSCMVQNEMIVMFTAVFELYHGLVPPTMFDKMQDVPQVVSCL